MKVLSLLFWRCETFILLSWSHWHVFDHFDRRWHVYLIHTKSLILHVRCWGHVAGGSRASTQGFLCCKYELPVHESSHEEWRYNIHPKITKTRLKHLWILCVYGYLLMKCFRLGIKLSDIFFLRKNERHPMFLFHLFMVFCRRRSS